MIEIKIQTTSDKARQCHTCEARVYIFFVCIMLLHSVLYGIIFYFMFEKVCCLCRDNRIRKFIPMLNGPKCEKVLPALCVWWLWLCNVQAVPTKIVLSKLTKFEVNSRVHVNGIIDHFIY